MLSDLLVGPVLLRTVLATGPIDDAYLTAHVATVLRALTPAGHPGDGRGGARGAAVRS